MIGRGTAKYVRKKYLLILETKMCIDSNEIPIQRQEMGDQVSAYFFLRKWWRKELIYLVTQNCRGDQENFCCSKLSQQPVIVVKVA